ncbi:hypothetical protein QUF76_04515 [Desulfobacterales bacterium HSG16]|nr:hypothetical protein [Desulfobacterales bacterium HSG16]
MANCKYKKGFLNLRDCKQPASGFCSSCNRPICEEHGQNLEDDSLVCLECYADQVSEDSDDTDARISDLRARRQVFRDTGYSGYYFGHSRRYGEEDYQNFETGSDMDDQEYDDDDDYGDEIAPDDFQDS